ncbi:hypothetical protein LTR47_009598 [Exophiala xenobiotica]|nr:hypothetical protein LTR41_010924 [Exophiala xenobiotica]KAK5225173.1 hypothetical protein LTR47_009598 [Exophiala xenobiotica]KAK5226715.1 hypothetical protein LTR72_002703 [Exophiala xenobiotica]KAK5243849.1 hypothetical protein LTS06_010475 [Exophiala xenobiotica]KAK5260687.1 hypothetical protein LTR40_003682 [Exophiala xenobiotica]
MAIEVLLARITELETFVTKNGLTVPSVDTQVGELMSRLRLHGVEHRFLKDVNRFSPGIFLEALSPQGSPSPLQVSHPVPISPSSNEPSARTEDLRSTTEGFTVQQAAGFDDFDFPDWAVDFSMLSALGNDTWPVEEEATWIPPTSVTSGVHLPPLPHDVSLPYGLHDLPCAESFITHVDDQNDDVDIQLSDTKGSLRNSAGGDLRYCGAGSNVDLLECELPCDDAGALERQGSRMIKEAGLEQSIEQELIDHFVDLYFAWQDSSFHVVDRDAYEQHKRDYAKNPNKSGSYSEALTNIMCAFGAMYEPRKGKDLPQPAHAFFVRRAKIWLDIELSHPRVATVQAIAILSSYQGAVGNDTSGWVYSGKASILCGGNPFLNALVSGMAMRLSYDVGLHIDVEPYVRAGRLHSQDAESRKAAFWGSFVIDQ